MWWQLFQMSELYIIFSFFSHQEKRLLNVCLCFARWSQWRGVFLIHLWTGIWKFDDLQKMFNLHVDLDLRGPTLWVCVGGCVCPQTLYCPVYRLWVCLGQHTGGQVKMFLGSAWTGRLASSSECFTKLLWGVGHLRSAVFPRQKQVDGARVDGISPIRFDTQTSAANLNMLTSLPWFYGGALLTSVACGFARLLNYLLCPLSSLHWLRFLTL